ncbi:GTP-binding protein [Streptomyces sp. NPDC047515]|uniref:CobW family GTP-binding protein n=1 Tax=Streptomyces sp. NPDC047515 TaxID=3155380 RepID=UPI0034033435
MTGLPGSGKTSLLQHILGRNRGLKIAVIKNDLGEAHADTALLLGAEENIFEMTNGCICCSARGDLVRILGTLIRRRETFDRILIEATGLADPAPVAQTFLMDDAIASQLRLDAVITLVDATHIVQHLNKVKPGEAGIEAVEQIAFADRIVLNKTDMAGDDAIVRSVRRIRAINPGVRIVPATFARIALHEVLDVSAFDLERALTDDPSFLIETEHQHDTALTSVGIELEGELDQNRLDAWLDTLLHAEGVSLIRSKGVLAIAGEPRQYVFQGVHTLLDGEFGRIWRGSEVRRNRLVLIGRRLDREALERGFANCLATAEAMA